jgi:hypothetical protein
MSQGKSIFFSSLTSYLAWFLLFFIPFNGLIWLFAYSDSVFVSVDIRIGPVLGTLLSLAIVGAIAFAHESYSDFNREFGHIKTKARIVAVIILVILQMINLGLAVVYYYHGFSFVST